jgi:hypothetical protein
MDLEVVSRKKLLSNDLVPFLKVGIFWQTRDPCKVHMSPGLTIFSWKLYNYIFTLLNTIEFIICFNIPHFQPFVIMCSY